MGGSETSHVYETSYVDPASKKVTMTSTNLTFLNIISVQETVIYKPASGPLADTHTEFAQEAKITAVCGGWQKIRNAVEDVTVNTYGQNAQKGKEGFESVLAMSRRVFGEEKMREQRAAA